MSTNKIKPKSHSFNDTYILLSDGNILYISKDKYDVEEKIVESVIYTKGESEKDFKNKINRFFLNDEGVYPINLAGPTVTKVIPWNIEQAIKKDGNAKNNTPVSKKIEEDPNYFQPGYFIDLRQLQMSRLNMITIPDVSHHGDNHDYHSALPIPSRYLVKTKNTFVPVPDDKQDQLSEIPKNINLYIAFFDDQDRTHTNTECYSYKVCYIPNSEIHTYIVKVEDEEKKEKEYIKHLKTYYGKTGVQAGALNPYDILSKNDFNDFINDPLYNCTINLGGGGGGDGATCYVANLATFKKS